MKITRFIWRLWNAMDRGLDDSWYAASLPAFSASGVAVTDDSAMRIAAFYACIKVIAETLACLPKHIYKNLPAGGREKALNHPLYDVLHSEPNKYQNSYEFFEMMTGFACLRGNSFAEIFPGPRGIIDQLVPLHPDAVKVVRTENDYHYSVLRYNGKREEISRDTVWHFRGLTFDGIEGLSLLKYAAEVLGLAYAAQEWGARLFANQAKPGGVLEHPLTLSEPAADRLKKSWQENYAGKNLHKVAILEEGMKWHQIGMNPEECQFLESRKFSRSEIASLFRIPPHMIGDLERATFSNIEQQAIEFVMFCILPWALRYEQSIDKELIIARPAYYSKFNAAGLLRGDMLSRYAAYAVGRQWGWLCVDDIRELEDMNPLPDNKGKIYLQPLNMVEPGTQPPENKGGNWKVPDTLEKALKLLYPQNANSTSIDGSTP